MYEHFLKTKVEVEEADRSMSHSAGSFGRPAGFDPAEGRVLLVGLKGSGRRELGVALAKRLGMELLDLEAEEGDLERIRASRGVVVVVPEELAAADGLMEPLRETGRVVYLMADAPLLAERLGARPEEREALVDKLRELEPKLMAGMHYLVPMFLDHEEILDRVLSFLRLSH